MTKTLLKLVQTNYPIEKGVPLPAPSPGRVEGSSKYPFARMKVGDSFVADKKQANFGNTVAYYAKKLGFKFTTRAADANTTRIWRVK